jgi:hypothetical protein
LPTPSLRKRGRVGEEDGAGLERTAEMDLSALLANIQEFAGPPACVSRIEQPATGASQSRSEVDSGGAIIAVLFSKDRPYQLLQTLHSMSEYVEGLDRTYVIVKSADEWKERYTHSFAQSLFTVHTVEESDFHNDLYSVLRDEVERGSRYLMFGVDDMIFIDRVDIRQGTHNTCDIRTITRNTQTVCTSASSLSTGLRCVLQAPSWHRVQSPHKQRVSKAAPAASCRRVHAQRGSATTDGARSRVVVLPALLN